jgi:hypothetical protein
MFNGISLPILLLLVHHLSPGESAGSSVRLTFLSIFFQLVVEEASVRFSSNRSVEQIAIAIDAIGVLRESFILSFAVWFA